MQKARIIYITCDCGQKIALIRLGKLQVDRTIMVCDRCLAVSEIKPEE